MEYCVLGPLEVINCGRAVVLPRGRGRALLAILVLHAGEVVSADRLIDELWGETPPPTVGTALHNLVSALRKRLEPARATGELPTVLQTCPPGYRLVIDRGEVDANRFRLLVEQAAGLPQADRGAGLRRALALWRGPALADFTYEPFAQGPIAELEELRLTAIEQRIDADLALGRHGEVVAELERFCDEHPLREGPRGQLMVALYRCGRQADALKVYGAARRMLVDELGVAPGPELQRLERAILDHDPALDVPPLPPPPPRAGHRPDPEATGGSGPWLAPGRKLLTIVFVELEVATTSDNGEDPEAVRALVRRGYEVVAGALEHHGGTVEGFIGDVVVAVFGAPVAHEDDAVRAVRASFELRQAVATLNWELEREGRARLVTRVGVNTGEVVVGDAAMVSTAASGTTVKWAARLQQAAGDDEVLIGDATRRLVDDAVLLEAAAARSDGSGLAAGAWRLLGLAAPPISGLRATPFTGRVHELRQLHTIFDRAVSSRRAGRLTVTGDPGVGKSRLAGEFAAQIGRDAQVVTGRCPPYGDGITFWPLREVVLQATGERGHQGVLDVLSGEEGRESIAAHVSPALGLTARAGPGEGLFPAIRRFFEVLARGQPLVVVLEDLHWAQPMLLELVEYLGRFTRGSVLLLCLARPELLETRPSWGQDQDGAQHLILRPLAADESERLVAELLGSRRLPADAVAQVLQTAQGNPLFLEQLLAALRTQCELAVPPSIHALLAARLDRLGPAERDLLRCASVAGIDFSVEALAALVPEEARPFLERHLQALQDKELIAPSPRGLLGQPAFGFRHVLIQMAASRSITRHTRSELHERFAGWLEARAGHGSADFEEVVGYHLEQACEARRTIGMFDEHTLALAEKAGKRLARSGLRAYERYDMAAAANLLSRAKLLLAPGHPHRRELLRRLAAAYQQLGRLHEGDSVLDELLGEVEAEGDRGAGRTIRLERTRIKIFAGPDPTPLAIIATQAGASLENADASPDELAQACHVLAMVHLRTGRMREMEEMARLGLAYADRAGNPRDELAARWNLAWAVEAGATPVPDAIRTCEELARWRGREHPGVLCELGSLRAMRGDFDEALELVTRGRRLLDDWMHARGPTVFAMRAIAKVDILAGDLARAEGDLRYGLEIALDIGLREQSADLAARLSAVLSVAGAPSEAEQLARLSMKQAPAESVAAQALGRVAMARVLVTRQEGEQAERLAREAAELPPADMLNLRADVLVDLAEVLLAAGENEAAHVASREAAEIYAEKGNVVAGFRALWLLQGDLRP